MIKILIGGSPCTYWSVAQKKGREVEAEGLGWELFRNYLIAKEKFKPDFFLYENNKSAAQPIKDQISHELGVDLMHINSALVSAQNRQRFYAFNWNVDQPADRGIMLKDILETETSEKGYELRAPAVGVGCGNRREDDGKLYRRFETSGIEKANVLTTVQTDSMSPEITITSEELRERVEDRLDRWIPDDVWNRAEPYARHKNEVNRQRHPEIDYYDNDYLVLLTADTVRETEFSDLTHALCDLTVARAQ